MTTRLETRCSALCDPQGSRTCCVTGDRCEERSRYLCDIWKSNIQNRKFHGMQIQANASMAYNQDYEGLEA